MIIATEGAVTEKAYFEGLVSADGYPNSQVHVEVLATEAGQSAPKQVIERLSNARKITSLIRLEISFQIKEENLSLAGQVKVF